MKNEEINILKRDLEKVFETKMSEMQAWIQVENEAIYDKVKDFGGHEQAKAATCEATTKVELKKDFECDQCNSNSKKGLKSHITKKHKASNDVPDEREENAGEKCPVCDYEPVYKGFIPPWEKRRQMLEKHLVDIHPSWTPP